jgi:hypothetical protein
VATVSSGVCPASIWAGAAAAWGSQKVSAIGSYLTLLASARPVSFRGARGALLLHATCVEAGSLMTDGPRSRDLWRCAAAYVDKRLKGAKAAERSVEPPRHFTLVINLTTAQAFGLTIPPSRLFQADAVLRCTGAPGGRTPALHRPCSRGCLTHSAQYRIKDVRSRRPEMHAPEECVPEGCQDTS